MSNKNQDDRMLFPKSRRLGYLSAAPRVSTGPNAEMGGPRAHVLGVIQGFRSLGWDVDTYIVGDRIPHVLIAQSEGQLERSSLIRLGADLVRLGMGLWHTYYAWRELHEKVNWVYERFAVLQSLGWIFQRRGTLWILETNGLLFYESTLERKSIFLSKLARMIELWAYRKCDVLICVNEAMKDLLVDLAGISPDKVLVVRNGVDIERCDPTRHRPKRLFDGPTLGFVGGLQRWRRLDLLLEALADIRREGLELNLTIVGEGPMRIDWENKAQERNLQNCVRFVGKVPWDESLSYVTGFDLGYVSFNPIDSSKMFGSPLKLYEYMAMALPVISSSFSDAWEMIVPGQSGYIFKPGDIDDLKRVLHLAYLDQMRWREMGKMARARVIETASWNARVQNMISGIEKILEKKGANSSA